MASTDGKRPVNIEQAKMLLSIDKRPDPIALNGTVTFSYKSDSARNYLNCNFPSNLDLSKHDYLSQDSSGLLTIVDFGIYVIDLSDMTVQFSNGTGYSQGFGIISMEQGSNESFLIGYNRETSLNGGIAYFSSVGIQAGVIGKVNDCDGIVATGGNVPIGFRCNADTKQPAKPKAKFSGSFNIIKLRER